MIPKNIKREHVIKAIEEIEISGFPAARASRKFLLEYNGKDYPPKYVLSIANKYANGKKLTPDDLGGGRETNRFLQNLGFEIRSKTAGEKIIRAEPIRKQKEIPLKKGHKESCKKCKETIKKLLEKIYGEVKDSPKFDVGTLPEDFKDTPYYGKLTEIYKALQDYRRFQKLVKYPKLYPSDLFVPDPGFIFEYDESQHFTLPRKIALEHYPENLKLGFDKKRWIELCERIHKRDNDKKTPQRDEQRAWYETIRDFLPAIKGFKPTVRVFMKDFQWCSLDPESPKDVIKFRELIGNKQQKLYGWWVATVLIKSNERYSNEERLKVTSQVVDLVSNDTEGDGVIIFPGGWFDTGKQEAKSVYEWAEASIKCIISKKKRNIIICLGIDGRLHRFPRDQIGIAISKRGIEAIGRKFHPTREEKRFIEPAESHLEKEENKSRTFELNGKKYFMCVCYDSFGIKHNSIPKMGVDAVLDLVHGFYPKGEGVSGTGNFARHGLAGASNQWKCPVFCATVFFRREIPETFPSGVYWDRGNTHSPKCTYETIRLNQSREENIKVKEGKVSVRIYNPGTI